ncbi:hypothetical protein BOX15_Mlig004609g1 [Macrostomum lignano]|uniref:Uncharacterized protein n=1 Tax=Macrostomum lignano TaxID=282301 RepID=A0A267H4S7_9PLAT|nr:hypothetical protein BOX15_Mlig004609g1 [Macrostomum lignano]
MHMLLHHLLSWFSPHTSATVSSEKAKPALIGEYDTPPLLLPPVNALHSPLLTTGKMSRT